MRKIAIITARGGSKRIPNKNRKLFLGKPILQYSIEAAIQADIFDEVMVSTDDTQIAKLAIEAGAKVPFYRSEKTANDYATTADVIEEVLACYQEKGQDYEEACCIYPTAPFVTPLRLQEAMTHLETLHAEAVMPVVSFSFPPQRCVVIREGELQARWPEHMAARSQDLEPYYHDAGQFYAIRVSAFRQQHKMIMTHTLPLILSEMEVQDIDTEEDWRMAELKYSLLHPDR